MRAKKLLRTSPRRHRRRGRDIDVPGSLPARRRLSAQHTVPVEHLKQRRRLLRQELRQVRQAATRRACWNVHSDSEEHRSGNGVHEQRERSDRRVRRPLQRAGALLVSRRRAPSAASAELRRLGLCNQMPEDDDVCGTIECNGLNTMCMSYQDLTTSAARRRARARWTTRPPPAPCSPTPARPTAAPVSVAARVAAAGAAARAAAPRAPPGTTAAAVRAAAGGGCCAIGASETPNAWVGLLVLASVMIVRRRRR